MPNLSEFGLAVGDSVTGHFVPWDGVSEARRESDHHADGRAYVADRVADVHGEPHDLVLLAVPPGKGRRFVEAIVLAGEIAHDG